MKSYKELIKLESYKERLEYLRLNDYNYDSPREHTQRLFQTQTWKSVRQEIINRDMAFDMGIFGMYIYDFVIVHHINPITMDDILKESDSLFDPNNLITVSHDTHNRIHYSAKDDLIVERKPGDTILW